MYVVQCLQRWKKALKPGLKKGSGNFHFHETLLHSQSLPSTFYFLLSGTWSDQEDALLTKLESQMPHVFKNWGKLAAHMPGRTSKQCRERWRQYLDPRLNRSLFSPQEDERLIQLYEKLGKQWSLIAKHLDGRTENSVCSRIKALMNKMKRTALLNDLRAKIKGNLP